MSLATDLETIYNIKTQLYQILLARGIDDKDFTKYPYYFGLTTEAPTTASPTTEEATTEAPTTETPTTSAPTGELEFVSMTRYYIDTTSDTYTTEDGMFYTFEGTEYEGLIFTTPNGTEYNGISADGGTDILYDNTLDCIRIRYTFNTSSGSGTTIVWDDDNAEEYECDVWPGEWKMMFIANSAVGDYVDVAFNDVDSNFADSDVEGENVFYCFICEEGVVVGRMLTTDDTTTATPTTEEATTEAPTTASPTTEAATEYTWSLLDYVANYSTLSDGTLNYQKSNIKGFKITNRINTDQYCYMAYTTLNGSGEYHQVNMYQNGSTNIDFNTGWDYTEDNPYTTNDYISYYKYDSDLNRNVLIVIFDEVAKLNWVEVNVSVLVNEIYVTLE